MFDWLIIFRLQFRSNSTSTMSYNRFYQGSRIDLFQRQYRAFSGAFSNKPEIDNGGKSKENLFLALISILKS